MILYKITNVISNSVYIGITKGSLKRRFYSHKSSAKTGKKTKLYDAMRKYGIDNFEIEPLNQYKDRESLEKAEISAIKSFKEKGYNLYNILEGGKPYFPIKDINSWKKKLRKARKGRKPSLGMKHSDENKEIFSRVSREYWKSQKTYDAEQVRKLSFKDANIKFGISKTHYYRLIK